MYKKIIDLLENKIFYLKSLKNNISPSESDTLKRLIKVKELVDESYNNIFKDISVEVAYGILKDIGIQEDQINKIYIALMKEATTTKKYTILNEQIYK